MNPYLMFILITAYMVITYHVIALKYRSSPGFPYLGRASRTFLVSLHVIIVATNILLYFWLIAKTRYPAPAVLRASGLLMFCCGVLIILWGARSLRRAVFVPEKKLITSGAFAYVRHPMYLGGIAGALGIAVFAASLPGLLYSTVLALVLSHISRAEEEDLRARFGKEYIDYAKKVPRLFPCMINTVRPK